ncbi:LysM peptidoglycan-binding domain-containing protein [Gordonia sp. ABSL1-1]|uniref:LysM peptidoglycan-binding domain-containing protein n=1 Tax=Gordonia sp. ABSL1-1 TaxID=3053923 RepID=UPI0025741885|nr:LysM peptidoglycan-binding domain-containing protein [Gordonia sp. ABSL1-1]MDL9936364.1 LysM peptidoglycan-binding domain-containing protein [Gordonia sp. ABSL1-1]
MNSVLEGQRVGLQHTTDIPVVTPSPARRTSRPAGHSGMSARRPVGRPGRGVATPVSASSTRCTSPVGQRAVLRDPIRTDRPVLRGGVYARRRACALAILAGVALAAVVWVVAIVGNNYAEAVSDHPVATEVTHVRAGDSLSSIASRVAPDMPRQAVIDDIIELNDLSSSGLRVGQPLLTPAYR